ncbi:C40 family peptidase [Paenibacillus thermotolerans]|uniref:C40 family peptidase n=1 Tax=Paenibacillus thermotolerans TaxID=3027807 RepID=UPI0030825470
MKKTAIALLAAGIAFGSMAGTAMAATKLETAVDKLLGIDYRYGGTTTAGFDCSGFTSYVFEKFGIELPRTSKDQANAGFKVARDELRPGDLVFFNTDGKGISHVGIYMGDGKFAHSSSKYGVKISELSEAYYSKRYVTARRILGGDNYINIATEAPKQEAAQPAQAEAKAAAETTAEPVIVDPAVDPVAAYTEQSLLESEDEETAALARAFAAIMSSAQSN